jgi:hypothetical protein
VPVAVLGSSKETGGQTMSEQTQTKPTAASPPPTLEDEARGFLSKQPIPTDYPKAMAAFARQQVSAARAEAVAEFVERVQDWARFKITDKEMPGTQLMGEAMEAVASEMEAKQ